MVPKLLGESISALSRGKLYKFSFGKGRGEGRLLGVRISDDRFDSELLLVRSKMEIWKTPRLRLSCDEPGSLTLISSLIVSSTGVKSRRISSSD